MTMTMIDPNSVSTPLTVNEHTSAGLMTMVVIIVLTVGMMLLLLMMKKNDNDNEKCRECCEW